MSIAKKFPKARYSPTKRRRSHDERFLLFCFTEGMANLFHRTGQKLTVSLKLIINGPMALFSAKFQGKDKKRSSRAICP